MPNDNNGRADHAESSHNSPQDSFLVIPHKGSRIYCNDSGGTLIQAIANLWKKSIKNIAAFCVFAAALLLSLFTVWIPKPLS